MYLKSKESIKSTEPMPMVCGVNPCSPHPLIALNLTMVGRWARWAQWLWMETISAENHACKTNTVCSFCLNFMHMNPGFADPHTTQFSRPGPPFRKKHQHIFAGDLGFQWDLFLHTFSKCPRDSPGYPSRQVSAWRTTIIDPSSSQDSSFALGQPVTASCTACPTWARHEIGRGKGFDYQKKKLNI